MMYKNVCGSLVCNSKMLKTTKIAIENRTECVIASWWTINNIDEFHKDSIRQKNPKPRRTNIELFHLHAVLEKSKLKDRSMCKNLLYFHYSYKNDFQKDLI